MRPTTRPNAGGAHSTTGYVITGQAALWARRPATPERLPITRLSPVDISFLPILSQLPDIGDDVPLLLCSGDGGLGPLPYRVTHLAQRDGHQPVEVTARLGDGGITVARNIVAMVSSLARRGALVPANRTDHAEEVIDDPERIRSLVRALFADRRRAFVRPVADGLRRAYAAHLTPDFNLLVEWGPGTPAVEPPYDVEIAGLYADYRFLVVDYAPGGGLPVPTRISRVLRRGRRRVHCPAGTVVSYVHPLWPEVQVTRRVRDVSVNGLSLATVPEADLLFPGLELKPMELTWKRGARIHLRGTVRHISPGIHGKGDTCGVAVTPENAEDAVAWQAAVEQLLHPTTRIGVPWHDDIWDVYTASGYLQLSEKQATEFSPLRTAFDTSSAKLSQAPHLGCQVTWPSPDRVEATISLLKAWQHSWLVYQLARYNEDRPLSHSGNDLLLDVYLRGYEHAMDDPETRWHVAYVQDAAHWSKLVHHAFPKRHSDGVRACVVPFRAWEGRCEDPLEPMTPPDLLVRRATPTDRDDLVATIARSRPLPYVEANDYTAKRLALTDIKRQWADAGMVRDREILVAHVNGVPRAAAILELAEDGLHLFGLLDLVRLFSLHPDGLEAFPLLLTWARQWYRVRGKDKFAYFDETGDRTHAEAAGLVDLGGASLTIIANELVPDLLEHVAEVTAPRHYEGGA